MSFCSRTRPYIYISSFLFTNTSWFVPIRATRCRDFHYSTYSHLNRTTHINPQEELEKDLNIPDEVISKIQKLIPKMWPGGKNDGKIKTKSFRSDNSSIFQLVEHPQFVFKFYDRCSNPFYINLDCLKERSREAADERFKNMIKGKKVCLKDQLNLLVIPSAKKIEIEGTGIIVEQYLDLYPEERQEELLQEYSSYLDETIRQLSRFIGETDFDDVVPHNIPILKEDKKSYPPRRIALIDLERMNSRKKGLFELIRCCMSEKQIDIVMEEMHKQNIIHDKHYIKNIRLNELARKTLTS
jgi:hypothetical protein